MNDSTVVVKYEDPDPESALFLGIWFAMVSTIGIPFNIFIVVATIQVRDIGKIPSNSFIGSLALSDSIVMLCLWLHLPYALTSSELLCKVIGFGLTTFAVLGLTIPPFLAMNRYAVVCRQNEKLARYMLKAFSRRAIYTTIVLLWVIQIVYQLPFALLDSLGIHAIGICSTTSMLPHSPFVRIYYYCGTLGIVSLINVPLLIFYRKVSSWVQTMSGTLSLSAEAKETIGETKSVLRLIKWITLIPIACSQPALIFAVIFEFNSNFMSIGVSRLIACSVYALMPLLNAIITLKFARSYRLAFQRVCERSVISLTLFSWIIEGNWRVVAVSDNNTSVMVART